MDAQTLIHIHLHSHIYTSIHTLPSFEHEGKPIIMIKKKIEKVEDGQRAQIVKKKRDTPLKIWTQSFLNIFLTPHFVVSL